MTYLGPQAFSLKNPVRYDDSNIIVLIGIDPGGTTGWSCIVLPDNVFQLKSIEAILQHKLMWVHGQVDCSTETGVYLLRRNLLDSFTYSSAVIMESFFLRKDRGQVDLSPVEIIAVIRHSLWMKHKTMHMQQPSMAKRLDNDRLKLLNVYTSEGGMQHARDADRHVLMMIRRCMENKGMKEKLWPNTFSTDSK